MDANTTVKKRKNAALSAAELEALKDYRAGFRYEVECAATVGVDRGVLNRIILTGSGAPENIAKVRKVLPKEVGADMKNVLQS